MSDRRTEDQCKELTRAAMRTSDPEELDRIADEFQEIGEYRKAALARGKAMQERRKEQAMK